MKFHIQHSDQNQYNHSMYSSNHILGLINEAFKYVDSKINSIIQSLYRQFEHNHMINQNLFKDQI